MKRIARQSQIGSRSLLALRKAEALSIRLGIHLALVWPACAALESGVYHTVPGATVEERSDGFPGGSRVVPLSASLTFDLSVAQPSLTAVISNAVLEGGAPFMLTVRSSSGTRLNNGTYRFTGDYLRDIEPSGTQYLFEWNFSTATNGLIVWNGIADWTGGHIWRVTISDIAIVQDTTRPKLHIMQAGSELVVSWPTNYIGFRLEQATSLPATNWSTVTNTVTTTSDRFSVTVETGAAQRFFRLSNQGP
jgi:hypothetical protein